MILKIEKDLTFGTRRLDWKEAEVQVSLDAAADHTYIPNARVDGSSVAVYFDDAGVGFNRECLPLRRFAAAYGGSATVRRRAASPASWSRSRLNFNRRLDSMKIDIFNHVMPVPYLDMMKQHLKDQGILKRMSSLRMLWDIEARVRMLDEKFPDVQQVLTLSLPSPELVGGPDLAPELARIANDGMAA